MKLLRPEWYLPHVNALSTTRSGGVSQVPYNSLNLGEHVGDMPSAVAENRALLIKVGKLPQAPLYLNQTHSTGVITLPTNEVSPMGDAVYTNQIRQVCLVMSADCLPVLFASKYGDEVAAAHAGWRGLCHGVLEATLEKFNSAREHIYVWLCPAIGASAFRVGGEVRSAFIQQDPQAVQAFQPDPHNQQKYYCDLYQIARQRLTKCGIQHISGGEYCTYSQPQHFFSYRRDGITGRMASLIWIDHT